MFYIGQKVVCVSQDVDYKLLTVVATYTIIDINENESLMFKEINSRGYGSGYFKNFRFRPLLTDSVKYAEKLLEEITIEINEENLVTK